MKGGFGQGREPGRAASARQLEPEPGSPPSPDRFLLALRCFFSLRMRNDCCRPAHPLSCGIARGAGLLLNRLSDGPEFAE